MALLAGVDGCRGGWFAVLHDSITGQMSHFVAATFDDLLEQVRGAEVVVIDMPIGLLDHAQHGGRECDCEARKLLGPMRGRSVFSAPVRAALREKSYHDALAVNRASSAHNIGISIQCFSLFPKLRQVDDKMTPDLQRRVKESHPEVAFALLNCGTPLSSGKKSDDGKKERLALLSRARLQGVETVVASYRGDSRIAQDDILDACALVHVARRILRSQAVCLPEKPPTDRCGLRMEIWG